MAEVWCHIRPPSRRPAVSDPQSVLAVEDNAGKFQKLILYYCFHPLLFLFGQTYIMYRIDSERRCRKGQCKK